MAKDSERMEIRITFREDQKDLYEYIKAKNVSILNKYSLAHIDGEKTKFTENITFSIISKGINIYSKEHVCLERIETSIEDMQKITV